MNFAFSEEQEELRAMARSFLEDQSSGEQVREAMASESGYDPAVWNQIGQELGWPALTVPEAYGGLGLSYVDLVALLEVSGEFLLCAPFFNTVALGVNTLVVAGSEEQKQAALPAIAEGEKTATFALTEASGRWDAQGIEATATADGDGYVLEGVKRYVPDGASADAFAVAVRAPGSAGESGVSLFWLDADTPGVERTPLPTLDQTRRQGEIALRSVRVPASARMGEEGAAWPHVQRILDLAAVANAAEQVGGAQRCLEMAVQYSKEREQFGRPIGSFQAIKHKCADMMTRVESARSAAYYAAMVASDPEANDELQSVASLCKSYCSDAYFACASENLQIHGGVGFTWEYDVHLYFKRAKSSEIFLGDPAQHRERVAQRIGL